MLGLKLNHVSKRGPWNLDELYTHPRNFRGMLFCSPGRSNFTLRWHHNGQDSVSNHQPHIVYSTVYSGTDQRKHQSSAPLAFVRGIHRGPVNSLHKGPVMRKMFPFDDVIMMCVFFYKTHLKYPPLNWNSPGKFNRNFLPLTYFIPTRPVCDHW